MDKIEKLNEKLSEYSDRQIVITMFEVLDIKDVEKLLNNLKRDYG